MACKRCLSEEENRQLKERIRDLVSVVPEESKTAPAAYAERMKACFSCENLVAGTCVYCGCYVELRAAKSHMSCPLSRWQNT